MLTAIEIEQNYDEFDDEKIIRILLHDARGLRKETIPIIENQIKKGKLDPFLINWIEAERKPLGTYELDRIKETINLLPCPLCKVQSDKILGFKIHEVTSMIINCSSDERELKCCQKCRQEKRKESNILTLVSGWWSLFGIILTPIALFRNWINSSKTRSTNASNLMIEKLINDNRGTIRLSNDMKTALHGLIHEFNKCSLPRKSDR
jgi:hypothetical protein